MKTTPSSGRPRPVIYLLLFAVIAAVLAVGIRFMPPSLLPFAAILLICPIAMFFMMRGMNGRPQ